MVMEAATRSPFQVYSTDQARQSAQQINQILQRFQQPISEITKAAVELAGEMGLSPSAATQLATSISANVSQVLAGDLAQLTRDGQFKSITWVHFPSNEFMALVRTRNNGQARGQGRRRQRSNQR